MVGEIVQEIGFANDEFATNFKEGAKWPTEFWKTVDECKVINSVYT